VNKIENDLPFDSGDISIIANALALFLNERSRAFELAAEVARAKNYSMPNHEDFRLTEILRLSRRFASHQSNETSSRAARESDRRSPESHY
jgi:hypothetical protein